MAHPMSPQIFISYSREDAEYLDRIKKYLKPLEEHGISYWEDSQIQAGEDWRKEIEQALNTASIALCLVSQNFLASDFIHQVELPTLLRRAEQNDVLIIPFLLKFSIFSDSELEPFLALPDPKTPLTSLSSSKQEEALCHLYKRLKQAIKTPVSTTVPEEKPATPERLFHIPIPENHFFTGRDTLLARLKDILPTHPRKAVALWGLPGIGKTQIAAQYAYQHRSQYQTVLWVQAENPDMLRSSFAALDTLLGLSSVSEQQIRIDMVRQWLNKHHDWLLIADNANDLSSIEPLLPSPPSGHVIFTTWNKAVSRLAVPLEVEELPTDDSAAFLARRAGIASDSPGLKALSRELGGWPLALDQAGAYMEYHQKNPQDYLDLYRRHAPKLLDQRGDVHAHDHPESVVKTCALSFEKMASESPAAQALLTVCAFLHPDSIPEDILFTGASALGETLAPIMANEWEREEVLAVMYRYALLRRHAAERLLTMHRLVQTVLKHSLSEAQQSLWAERASAALALTLPPEERVEFEHWPIYKRLLPCLQKSFAHQQEYSLNTASMARMLSQTAQYFYDQHAEYATAEAWVIASLSIREKLFGTEHPDTAFSLNNLARLHHTQGHYAEALPLLQQALNICQNSLGEEHSDTATSLNNLAGLYRVQGQYAQALPLYQQALCIRQNSLGGEHSDTAISLNNLAALYQAQGQYAQALPLFQRALKICQNSLGKDHPDTATSLNNLAGLYQAQGQYAQALPLFQQALSIRQNSLGQEHPDTASSLSSLAGLYRVQGEYVQALPLFQQALSIRQNSLGQEHPDTANSLNNLAALYQVQGEYAQALLLYQQALKICQNSLGKDHPHTANSLNNLAALYQVQGEYAQALPLYQQALKICQNSLGKDHPHTANSLNNLAVLYAEQAQYTKARHLLEQALKIRTRTLGQRHPDTRRTKKSLQQVKYAAKRSGQAPHPPSKLKKR